MDAMMQAYKDFTSKGKDGKSATELQVFQAGYSASAQSMRTRAMQAAFDALNGVSLPSFSKDVVVNAVRTAIGQLSDI